MNGVLSKKENGHIQSEDGDVSTGSDADLDSDQDQEVEYSDKVLLGDLLSEEPKKKNELNKIVVVDNIPAVGMDKFDKLEKLIRTKFSKYGTVTNFEMPLDPATQQTNGFCFVTYGKPEDAKIAANDMDGKSLDKQHIFQTVLLSEVEKCMTVDKEWKAPAKVEYKDHGNLHYWLLHEACWDQFAVVYGGLTISVSVFWNTPSGLVQIEDACRNHWTESMLMWSPKGTYLATFHAKGICLWGGEKFAQIRKFQHNEVSLIDFSPCERYMVTYSNRMDSKEDPQALIIWNVVTQFKRGFHHEMSCSWPVFKWNYTGKYFARLQPDAINVYETPNYTLLDKAPLKLNGVQDFSWSPTENILAYWVKETENAPARVTLLEMPSRRELCVKNLFSVSTVRMYWQSSGDYLCVRVTLYTKKKVEPETKIIKYYGLHYSLHILRLREKQIPVEKLEIKETVTTFAWEPKGTKFAFIQTDAQGVKTSVLLYDVPQGANCQRLKTWERASHQKVNELCWSPRGQILILAGIKHFGGIFEFVDTNDQLTFNVCEHPGASDIEWDPTGRYVATWVSCQHNKQDCQMWLWSAAGRQLNKLNDMKPVNRVLWRPRPPTLLSEEELKTVKKNLKTYITQFEKTDKLMHSKASRELYEKRKDMNNSFALWRKQLVQRFNKEKPERVRLRGGIDTEDVQEASIEEEEMIPIAMETIILKEVI